MIFIGIWIVFVIAAFLIACGFLHIQKKNVPYVFLVNVIHYSFAWVFLSFSEGQINDSFNYYTWAVDGLDFGYTGTGFIVTIVKVFLWLGISDYFIVFLFFSTLSNLAILVLFNYLLNKNKNGHYSIDIILFCCFLLPGLHFWTVSIGKDSISIVLIALMIIASFERKFIILSLLFIALFVVRSHIALLLGSSFGLFVFLYVKIGRFSHGVVRIILTVLSIPVFALALSYVLSIVQKYSSVGFDSLGDFIADRQNVYASTDAGAILVGQPYIIKIFAQIFGAIPWLSMNVLTFVSLMEGVVIFILLLYSFKLFFLHKNKSNDNNRACQFWILFVITFILFMPIISTNLGIMVRMRVMIYLPVFVVVFYLLQDRYLFKIKRKSYV